MLLVLLLWIVCIPDVNIIFCVAKYLWSICYSCNNGWTIFKIKNSTKFVLSGNGQGWQYLWSACFSGCYDIALTRTNICVENEVFILGIYINIYIYIYIDCIYTHILLYLLAVRNLKSSKISLVHSFIQIVESFSNFAQSTAAILQYFVQNWLSIHLSQYIGGWRRISQYPLLSPNPEMQFPAFFGGKWDSGPKQ